jgi:hypothetical protein
MLFAGGFSFANFLVDVLTVFAFVIRFWFKALWVIGVVLFPYLGVLAYAIFQGEGMRERRVEGVQQAREELRNVIGFKQSGSITDDEFTHLRAKVVKAA